MTWALALHGGAKEIAPAKEDANRAGCRRALAAGRAVLERGGTALDAVEAAIRVLEDDPTFNAGLGSVPNGDDEIEMDAAMMDGGSLAIGAVAAIRGVRHPISVARLLLDEAPILLVGDGARRFAVARGAELWRPPDPAAAASGPKARHDTVGCVALDQAGRLATGTSTGGLSGTLPGRVGDSPLPGCGFYADAGIGAVALSGDGEQIARTLLAARAIQFLQGAEPQAAIDSALAALPRVGGEAGGILVDARGRIGWAHNSRHFAVGLASAGDREGQIFLSRAEATGGAHHG